MTTIEQTSDTPTMRAVVVSRWGGSDVLEAAVLPRPTPGPTEILVAVHAAGVNPVDWKSRASGGFGMWEEPPIIGWDVSGVVAQVGGGSSLYRVGDEVFGMPRFPRQAGAYAEYVVAPSRQFAPKPAALDHAQAAALPLVGLTAWQGLSEFGGVQPGQRVLVHGAGGGLGHVAVQVAKALGAEVIGTASQSKHEWLRSLGIDDVIDYTAVDFTQAVSDVDLVFDTIGGDYAGRSLAVLRDGGTLVSITGPTEPGPAVEAAAAGRGIRTGWTLVEPDRHGLLAIADLVATGKLRPVVAHVFPLAGAGRAHELGEQGHLAGKLVLEVGDWPCARTRDTSRHVERRRPHLADRLRRP